MEEDHPSLILNDVSRMSATPVKALAMPRSQNDVFEALEFARSRGLSVVARGTSHSMGGHSLTDVVLDMKFVDNVEYNVATGTVQCGAGATWSKVIQHLNNYGKSPRTLQSYCTFSVGGSVSVNAHGITSDHPVGESVVSLTILRLSPSGKREVLVTPKDDSELHSLAVGGYGLFGVIYDVTLRVTDNRRLWMDSLHLSPPDFVPVYNGLLEDELCTMKLARIDITNFEHIALYVFRSDSAIGNVSDLPCKPREMSKGTSILFELVNFNWLCKRRLSSTNGLPGHCWSCDSVLKEHLAWRW
jgi:hypothetical protein